MQMQRLSGYYVDPLGVLHMAAFSNLDVIAAGAQVHRLVLVRRARVGAVDIYGRILHLGIQLDFARIRMRRSGAAPACPACFAAQHEYGARCRHRHALE